MTQDRIAIINGLRGAAILAVIYHHVFSGLTPPGTGATVFYGIVLLPYSPLSNGWLGVNLFFLLSGFVLALPYERHARRIASWGDVRTFWVRRAARILPLYYVVSLVCFAFGPPAARTLGNFLHLLFVTFPLTPDTFIPAYNWVLWSLGVEIGFSVLFPALVWTRQRVGLWRLLLASLVLSEAVRIVGSQPRFWGPNPVLNYMKDGVAGRLDDFVLGMVIAAVFVRHAGRELKAWQRRVLFAVALLALFGTFHGWDAVRLGWLDRGFAPFLNNLFQIGCAAGVVALLFSPDGWIRRAWTLVPLQLLGMMCYSLYVWHAVLLRPIAHELPYAPERLAAYLGFVLLLSTFSYRYIEFGHVRDARALFRPAGRS